MFVSLVYAHSKVFCTLFIFLFKVICSYDFASAYFNYSRPLQVRADEITEGDCKDTVLCNAALTEEDYFVAPPGNIPIETRDNLFHEEENRFSICSTKSPI